MASTSSGSRSRIRARRRQAKTRSRIGAAAIAAGVLVLGVALFLYLRPTVSSVPQEPGIDYRSEDVARTNPMVAVHEMSAGPPIPFLPSTGPQPQIVTSEDYVDVGSVGPTEVVRLDFVIANTGEAPLTISRAYTTCGCTTAEISSSVIPPGRVAEVALTFDAGYHDTRGQVVRRGLIIENNDPERSIQEIWIQASVRSN